MVKMNIREPRHFDKVRAQRQAKYRHKKLRKFGLGLFVALLVASLLVYGAYLRPLPSVVAKTVAPTVSAEQVALTWPAKGQAAIGVAGQGVMASTANQVAAPTASTAKVMLVLAVLKKHPLQPGEAGPLVPITEADVALYNKYLSMDGSVVKVQVGEQLTEYQALQAALIASGNNVADSLAIWAYGSMADYHKAANQLAQELGMTSSKFASDASGFLPETVSTAQDLTLLGQAALANPVIKDIVSQKSALLPVAGTIYNTNFLLGQQGVIGIKSGNTDQAGGCFIFASQRTITGGQTVTAVGAVMGAASFGQAAASSLPLLNSFYAGFSQQVVVPKGTVVARYKTAWGEQTNAVTVSDTVVLNWRGSKAEISLNDNNLKAPLPTNSPAGSLSAETAYGQTTTQLITSNALAVPSWQWRIIRH